VSGVTRIARRVVVHAAILTLPALAMGRVSDVTRPTALACIAVLLLLGEAENASRTAPDPSTPRGPGTTLALASALGLLATAWTALALPSLAPSSPLAPWTWLGAPVVLAGIALRVAAIRTLGRSFTSEIVAAPGHPLVTRGIYAHLRHPSDAGLLLIAVGVASLAGSAASAFVALVSVFPSVFLRIAAEDRVLAARDPIAHAAYRKTVRPF
jgi:protein-S-isoprenylcysteine O-methyltransferase Ste14